MNLPDNTSPSFSSELQAVADALYNARSNKVAIPRVSERYNISSLEEAYAVAKLNSDRHCAKGARIVGKKVGLTSQAVQQQLGVDQPDFGLLFDDMEYLNGADIPVNRFLQPKIEAEIAFVVGRDLRGHKPSYSEFLAALTFALPALEIVDSAIENWSLTLVDTVADNASCGVYVLGDQPVSIGEISMADLGMQLHRNGKLASQGCGVACLGHPLRAAYWLACIMAEQGEGLAAGEVILSGALGPMVPIHAGDHVSLSIAGMAQVNCQFV